MLGLGLFLRPGHQQMVILWVVKRSLSPRNDVKHKVLGQKTTSEELNLQTSFEAMDLRLSLNPGQ